MIRQAVVEYGLNIKKITYSTDSGSYESCPVLELKSDHLSAGSKRLLAQKIDDNDDLTKNAKDVKNKKGKKRWSKLKHR